MNTLYQDKFCKITDVCIIIYKYYFPLATSRTILFTDIQKITLESSLNVRHKWGPSTHCLNNWFHYDVNRRKKEKFIAIHIKGRRIVPSLTPEDSTKVFELLRSMFTQKVQQPTGATNPQQQPKLLTNQKMNEQQIEQVQHKQMIKMKYDQQSLEEEKPSQIQLMPEKRQ